MNRPLAWTILAGMLAGFALAGCDKPPAPLKTSKGETSGDEPMIDPPGEKIGYVLKGTIEIRAGEDVHELYEGDSISFPADVPHSWVGIDGDVIEVIWVQTPPAF